MIRGVTILYTHLHWHNYVMDAEPYKGETNTELYEKQSSSVILAGISLSCIAFGTAHNHSLVSHQCHLTPLPSYGYDLLLLCILHCVVARGNVVIMNHVLFCVTRSSAAKILVYHIGDLGQPFIPR